MSARNPLHTGSLCTWRWNISYQWSPAAKLKFTSSTAHAWQRWKGTYFDYKSSCIDLSQTGYKYPYSKDLNHALLQVCKYIDIPLQHINNLTLLGMNRPPRAHTENLLLKLRSRIPDLVLRTTFISGFPGTSGIDALRTIMLSPS